MMPSGGGEDTLAEQKASRIVISMFYSFGEAGDAKGRIVHMVHQVVAALTMLVVGVVTDW